MRRAEQRTSTTAVDGRLPLRLEKEQLRGYRPGSFQQIVRSGCLAPIDDGARVLVAQR